MNTSAVPPASAATLHRGNAHQQSSSTPPVSTSRKTGGGFRTDIQGLRAIAVGLVLLYHANVSVFSGGFIGVDMFFVISGFLITGLLIREVETTGRIDLKDFYARRVRRILPAATVVLVFTLLVTMFVLPPIRWKDIATEAAGAALYVANWIFAAGTGYQNEGVAVSPLQHFWTLSVEEQFYILWPILLIGSLIIAKRRTVGTFATNFTRTATIAVFLVIIPSFAWSVFYTATSPAPAYFVTTTRLWEMAIGSALALLAVQAAKIPSFIAKALGWAGLATILIVSVTYTSGAPLFPGASALLPTLGTAALIIAGMNGRMNEGVGRLLSTKPMLWVGDLSYSLYLWHWPLIVFGTHLLDGNRSPLWGILIVALSFLPAWFSYTYIEVPFQKWQYLKTSAVRALKAGGIMILITGVAVGGTYVVSASVSSLIAVAEDPAGAVALTTDFSNDDLSSFSEEGAPVDVVIDGIAPLVTEAREDNAQYYGDKKCHRKEKDTEPADCVFGDENAETEVVLVGDSHAANWAPPLIEIAETEGWKLKIHTKSGCGFALVEQTAEGQPYRECSEWTEKVFEGIVEASPDLVITSNAGRRGVIEDGEVLPEAERVEAFGEALEETWSAITEAGTDVLVIADTPEMGKDVPDCVSENPTKLTKCATPRDEALEEIPRPELEIAPTLEGVEVIQMDNWVCPDEDACPAVVGNTLVWRDSHHLTTTYAETLTEPLKLKVMSQLNA